MTQYLQYGSYAILAACSAVACAQTTQSPPKEAATSAKDKVAQALDALKRGDLAEADIGLLATAGAVQAIPGLKKQFGITREDTLQGQISKDLLASALVRLGDKDPAAWDYLATGVQDAIAIDAPSPARFDANGKLIPGPSPDFIAWAKAHNLTTDAALQKVNLEFLGKVAHLGETRDPRAIPLLRQALLSPNFLIQATAARELAQFHDKASIPLIIEACQQAPADAAFAIANALTNFNDPQAQAAAKVFRRGANGH